MTKHVPGQTVERVLDMRERRVVIDGAYTHFSREGEGAKDPKGPAKVSRICAVLDEPELSDQEIAIDYRHQQAQLVYAVAMQKIEPGQDVPKKPRVTEKDVRGEARTFVVPLGIDAAIKDVLKAGKGWPMHLLKYVDSTKRAFGIADDDADFLLPEEKAKPAPAEDAKA
jgi:hypothetical protein